MVEMANGNVDGHACIEDIMSLVESEISEDMPNLSKISVSLGIIEAGLTDKSQQAWPLDFKGRQENSLAAFSAFADGLLPTLDAIKSGNLRSKVKAIADSVWAKLTGAYSNNVHHVQHLYTFTQILETPKGKGKRQLDCASVVLTTLVTCHYLAQKSSQHAHLHGCRLQVSEDHCWINYDPEGARQGSVEVTTDSAARRGKVISEEAWQGWLYTGGQAVLCSPKMAVAALVASINPSIIARQNTGTDSEALQQLQHDLLQLMRQKHPEALYPAALCAFSDLVEIDSQDRAHAAILAAQSDEAVVNTLRSNNEAQGIFEEAIELSKTKHQGGGRLWYPYSYVLGYILRRVQFLLDEKLNPHRGPRSILYAEELLGEALRWCGSRNASSVLRTYRFTAADEQLYKDVEGVWEMVCDALTALSQAGCDPVAEQSSLLRPVLELWDAICCCWLSKPKPAPWINLLLRTTKLFSPQCRQQASESAQVYSQAMQQVKGLWEGSKPAQIKPYFEAADVDSNRPSKRPRKD